MCGIFLSVHKTRIHFFFLHRFVIFSIPLSFRSLNHRVRQLYGKPMLLCLMVSVLYKLAEICNIAMIYPRHADFYHHNWCLWTRKGTEDPGENRTWTDILLVRVYVYARPLIFRHSRLYVTVVLRQPCKA